MKKKKRPLNVVSFDPSLNNWGIAYLSYTPFNLDLLGVDIVQTKPISKSKLSKAQQDLSRADTLIEGIKDSLVDADVVVIELPIGSQSAMAMKSYGACLGLISSIQLPKFYVSPYDVKNVIGTKTTTKEQIIDWVNSKHPNKLHKHKSKAEHQADAVLACYAAEPQLRVHYENYFN